MNGKKGFILGFAVCMIIMSAGFAIAITQYFMNMTISIEKKPSNYIPDTNSLILTSLGGWGGGSFGKVNTTESGVTLPVLQDNETVSIREFQITNMNNKYNYTVSYTLSDIPEGSEVIILTKTGDIYDPTGRAEWKQDVPMRVSSGRTVYFWISITDIGMNDGTSKFMMNLTAIQE
jgi:hypothetical protein